MKRLYGLLALVLALVGLNYAGAATGGYVLMNWGTGDPTGGCTKSEGLYVNTSNARLWVCPNTTWVRLAGSDETGGGPSGEGVPAGSILLVDTGSCPTGFSEVSALNGKTLVGTLVANGNVGSTGGNDNITPAGSVAAPTFTGTPFSGVINHTHAVTDPGHNHTQNAHSHGMAEGTTDGSGTFMDRSNAASAAAAVTDAATATNIAATTGISTQNPAGGVASITPAGTNSAPSFTGTQFDNRSAFARVIFCKKD